MFSFGRKVTCSFHSSFCLEACFDSKHALHANSTESKAGVFPPTQEEPTDHWAQEGEVSELAHQTCPSFYQTPLLRGQMWAIQSKHNTIKLIKIISKLTK